jgi:hypothetical protein
MKRIGRKENRMRLAALLGIMFIGAVMAVGGAMAEGPQSYNADDVTDLGQFVVVFGLVLLTLELFGSAVRAYLKERRARKKQPEGSSD